MLKEPIMRILHLGVNPLHTSLERVRIMAVNFICVVASICSLIYIFVGWDSKVYVLSLLVHIFILSFTLFLHSLNKYALANLFIILSLDISYCFYATAFEKSFGTELFIIVILVVILFYFSQDKWGFFKLGFTVFSYLLSLLLRHQEIYVFDCPQNADLLISSNHLLGTAFLIYLIFTFRASLDKSRKEVNEKNKILAKQRNELEVSNQIKDRLFSIISHDLRSPLNSIKGILQLISDNDLSESQVRSLFPKLISDVNHTSGLLESLLQWAKSRMEGIEITPQDIDIQEIVDENIALFENVAGQKRIRLSQDIQPNIHLLADKDMFNSIIRNLISNALKFTNEKGLISVSVASIGNKVEIRVSDNGIGMSKDVRDKLFKETITTRGTKNEKGTGLGLLLVKEFVKKNNGTIHIESEIGEGSTFVLNFFKIPAKQFHTVGVC